MPYQRNKTLSVKEMRRQLGAAALNGTLPVIQPYERPRTRGDCEKIPRPCPFVGCRYHLYLDVTHRGSILLNHPDKEPGELEVSCSLDVADEGHPADEGKQGGRGPGGYSIDARSTLDAISETLSVSRERIRQIEADAIRKIRDELEPLKGR